MKWRLSSGVTLPAAGFIEPCLPTVALSAHDLSGHRHPDQGLHPAPARWSGGEGLTGPLSHVGRAISHASPSARQSKRISPFSWPRIMLSITRVPKPRRAGGSTGGPPVSVQRRTSRPSGHATTPPERAHRVLTVHRTWPRWSQARARQPQLPGPYPAAAAGRDRQYARAHPGLGSRRQAPP